MIKLNIKLKNIPCYVYMNIVILRKKMGRYMGIKDLTEKILEDYNDIFC